MSIELIRFLKASLIHGGITLVWAFYLLAGQPREKARKAALVVLVLLTLLAVPAYFDFGEYPKFGSFLNPHDFFHYYLGSKYSHEVGYQHLYPAVLVASAENNRGIPRHDGLRNMQDYGFESPRTIMRDAEKYRDLFTPERWEEFKADVENFRDRVSARRWSGILRDKGYNATPVWNMIARVLSQNTPSHDLGNLLALDLLLIAAMVGAVWWAFGFPTAMFALLFFCTLYPMSYTHIRGAFLRLDWVTTLVISMACMHRGRYGLAGGFAAYAAAARIFPVVFVVGVSARMLWCLWEERKLAMRYVWFFGVFGTVLGVLVGASLITDGIGHWQAFFEKIRLHDEDLSPMRIGFRYVFLNTYENPHGSWVPFEAEKLAWFAEHKTLWWAIQALVLAAVALLSRRLRDYEAMALGYVLAYFLLAPTFYYHVMLLTPLFLFLPRIEEADRAAGTTAIFLVSVVLYALDAAWPLDLALSYVMSWLLLLLCLYMAFTAGLAWRKTAMAPVLTPEGKSKRRKTKA